LDNPTQNSPYLTIILQAANPPKKQKEMQRNGILNIYSEYRARTPRFQRAQREIIEFLYG